MNNQNTIENESTKLPDSMLYFKVSAGDMISVSIGDIIPDAGIVLDCNGFKDCVKAHVACFNKYQFFTNEVPVKPFLGFLDMSVTSVFELVGCTLLSIYKYGPQGFCVEVPIHVLNDITNKKVTLLIGSPEFHDRISDLSDMDKQRSIDRLLTRAFQQRSKQAG